VIHGGVTTLYFARQSQSCVVVMRVTAIGLQIHGSPVYNQIGGVRCESFLPLR
jgi:hypothetical protein